MKKILFLLIATMYISSTVFAQTQIGVDIEGEAADDQSGRSVSMPDAYTVAIGAAGNDENGSNAGHVRIYNWNGSAWLQKGADIDGEAAGDESGYSVSMPDANTVAIGARNNDGNGNNSGHVRIYTWNGSAWSQKGIDIDGEAAGDQSGYSVSMPDANTVAIGAIYNNGNGNAAGHLRIYTWNGSAWAQKGADIDGEAAGDQSGYSVSMPDINTVAISAIYNEGNGFASGHVRIFTWNGSVWSQKGMDIDGEAAGDFSGWSVSMPDANTVAIGAVSNAGNGNSSGHVRIYTWNGSAWTQKGGDIDGEAANDQSGNSVSMPDANTVAIGASNNIGSGNAAGHVRIYSWNGSAWTQKGLDIDGEDTGDIFGCSVSMPDANTVAIGAFNNDGNGNNAGHVRVYSFCTPSTGTDIQTACESYTWIDGNTYTASNNTATHTLTNVAGCDSVVTLDLTINPIPNNNVTETGALLEADQAGANYQWLDCDDNYSVINTATNQSYTPEVTGNYAVEITLNGCADTSSCYLIDFTGISELEAQVISIHPNPASNMLFISGLDQVSGVQRIKILSVSGKVVSRMDGLNEQIDVAKLPNGVYILKILHETRVESIRFVKQ